jgi:hypothetical protein
MSAPNIGARPAFPTNEDPGMTVRMWLIGQALAGGCGYGFQVGPETLASSARDIAGRVLKGEAEREQWLKDKPLPAAPSGSAPGAAAASPAESTMSSAAAALYELPRSADPLEGIEKEERADPELAAIIGQEEPAVNAYLIAQRRIKIGQTYRSLPADFRGRILKNPAGFLSVVRKGAA